MLAFVESETDAPRYDFIFAADVFVYCADIAEIAQAMAAILAPGGLIAFTVETHDGEGAILRETLRFAHSAATVRGAISHAGLKLISLDAISTRTEKDIPVPGLVAVASASP
jgi:predicted TPR repeat methyltransferase